MRAGNAEAFDLFRKWLSEETLIECKLNFPLFRSRFRARVREISSGNLKLWSDDTKSELALRIEPWMEFGYGDACGVEGPDRFEGLLMVFFRVGVEGEEADFISFTEVVEQSR
jgi:hypothetical protein